jgi:hypothetical protein
MFSSKPINRHYLFTISCEGKIVNLENLLTQFFLILIGMLSKLVTPGVLHCGKHSKWESVTCGSPLARGRRQPWSLSQRGLACWQTHEPRDINHCVNIVFIIFSVVCIPCNTSLYLHFIHCACVVALVIS